MTYPAAQDFEVSNNATWDVRFTVPAADGAGLPFDLNGKSIRAQIRPAADSTDVTLDASNSNGLLTIYDKQTWGFSVDAKTAATIPTGSFVYDVLATLPNDPRVWRFQKGGITVDEGVTR